jgi:hypothetical protein
MIHNSTDTEHCPHCNKPVHPGDAYVSWFYDLTGKISLHINCAEEFALMVMRDVDEIRCGKEFANSKYRKAVSTFKAIPSNLPH